MAQSANWVQFIRMAWVGLAMQAGLSSAAMAGPAVQPGHRAPQAGSSATTPGLVIQWAPIQPAAVETPAESASEAIDKLKAKEIMGIQDDHRTTRKFLELVVLPLGVCLALILLLRRGFLN